MSLIQNIKRHLGLEPIEEKLQRFEEIRKSFEESDRQLDELAKDFFIEKSMYEARMNEPENYPLQLKIQGKFDIFIKGHKESIRKAKKQFDSLKKEKDEIKKAFLNHKYIRKEPDGKGGWNYVYEEKKNESKIEDWRVQDIDSIIQEYSDYGLEINRISYSDRDVFASYKNNTLLIGKKLTSKGNLYKVAKEDKLVTERVREKMNPTQSYKTILAYSDNEDDAFNLIVHHELGHAILEKLSNKNFYNTKLKSVSEIRDELLSTLKKEAWNISIYAGKQHPLLHSSEEGFAESWALYKVKPELLREKFPNIFNVIHKLDTLLIGDFNKSILGEFGDQCIATIEEALKHKKETAYEKIKKAYQHGQISLDSFNTIIKGLTKEEKTKYADFLLFNEGGELLLLKRSSWEDDNAGAWVIPGGHVDPGEDFKTAAIRELQEESGYNIEDAENVGSYEDEKCHIEYFQAYINTNEKPLLLQFAEVRDYKWIPIDEIFEEAMVFNMRDNILKILGIEDQDRNKKIIRKAILEGIIPVEMIEKAKSGIYKPTAENKKLGRVGQKYGEKREENEPIDEKEFYSKNIYKEGVELVPINEIEAFKEFDRESTPKWGKGDNTLQELEEEIKRDGIKTPISLEVRDGKGLITEGNHRLAVAKRLGLKYIPVKINDSSRSWKNTVYENKAKEIDKGSSGYNLRKQSNRYSSRPVFGTPLEYGFNSILPNELDKSIQVDIQKSEDKHKLKLERLETRRADKQYTKEEADYVDNFVDGDHQEENSCDRCGYYRPKEKDNCLKVIGEVSHNGHCKFWEHSSIEKGRPHKYLDKKLNSEGKFDYIYSEYKKEESNNYEKIKDYAKRIIEGREQIKRLSPEEERGRIRSGRANVEGVILIGTNATASDGSKEAYERRPIQEQLLEEYAKASGLWIDHLPEFNSKNFIDSGAEAKVYKYGNNKVIKINNLSQHEEPVEFLDRVAIHNFLFPDTYYEVVGFMRNEDDDFCTVVKQPFIEGKGGVERQDVVKEMEKMGFSHEGGNSYRSDDYLIDDLHKGNILNTKYGYAFIDPIIYLNKQEDGYGGKRELGSIELSNTLQKAYLLGLIPDDLIEKAWKKQPIGTVTTRKDGQQYRKVAETGNMDQDWKLVSKDKVESGEPKKEGNNEAKQVKGGDKPIDSKELEIHAKNASESTLQAAIKESADEQVRISAHEELDRRSKEEAVQWEKKEATKPVEKEIETKKKESKFIEKFRELSDSQLEFYLSAPNEEVKSSAKEILKERGLRTETKEEYEKKFKDLSDQDPYSLNNELYEKYKKDSVNIQKYLKENTEIEESVGVYVGSLYPQVRKYLDDPENYHPSNPNSPRQTKEYLKKVSDDLSELIKKNTLNEDTVLYRSLRNDDFLQGLEIGDIYEETSFSSTSLQKLKFGDFMIKILAKKGSKVSNLDNKDEHEYLIDKNSKFKVIEINKKTKNLTVELL